MWSSESSSREYTDDASTPNCSNCVTNQSDMALTARVDTSCGYFMVILFLLYFGFVTAVLAIAIAFNSYLANVNVNALCVCGGCAFSLYVLYLLFEFGIDLFDWFSIQFIFVLYY